MDERSIPLADIESVLGVKITAAELPEIGEHRIRISLFGAAKIVVAMSHEGKWQNAANFAAKNGGPLTEHIVVLQGAMEIATPGDDGVPQIQQYASGSVATIDACKTHATRPLVGSRIVGLMSSDWQGATRTADPAFDAEIQRLVAGAS